MTQLTPPHGGLSEPICRTVESDAIADFRAHADTLTKVPVSDADLSTVYRLGDGGLSPLVGPMDCATYDRVLDESVIDAYLENRGTQRDRRRATSSHVLAHLRAEGVTPPRPVRRDD
ncbi:MAG: hypothetical protein V3R99_04210, partial [Thermoguttaceae bacterium]